MMNYVSKYENSIKGTDAEHHWDGLDHSIYPKKENNPPR